MRFLFFFYCYGDHRDLHSFPTRRSSDLVTPKAFADLVRFDRFVDLAGRAAERGWAALAVDAGFYDQSHLIRVFRRFTGLTPRSEEHTSELQSRPHLVCRLLLEKKNEKQT